MPLQFVSHFKHFSNKGTGKESPKLFNRELVYSHNGRIRLYSKRLLREMEPYKKNVEKVVRQARTIGKIMQIIEVNHGSKKKAISSREKLQLKGAIIAMEKSFRDALEFEKKFMMSTKKGPKEKLSKDRVHNLENAVHIVNAWLEELEYSGIVEKGFKTKCLVEAGIINKPNQ